MNSVQKIALSLLIAVVVFSVFTVLAFSGLFNYLETTFYDPRVSENVRQTLSQGVTLLEGYHRTVRERFGTVLSEPAVQAVFRANQSREDIQARANYFGRLQEELPSLSYVRFIGATGQRLWYSTRPQDILSESNVSRTYKPLENIESAIPVADLVLQSSDTPDILLDALNNQFIYRFPVIDEFDINRGTALFYVSTSGVGNLFMRNGVIDPGQRVAVGQNSAVLFNLSNALADALQTAVESNWNAIESGGGTGGPIIKSGDYGSFLVFTAPVNPVGTAVYLAPESLFRMNSFTRIVLLSAVFLTTFLVVFLILNLRQDPMVVLAERVKRFQINLVREYMESKEELDWQRWQTELEDRREETTDEIKKGIGKLRGKKEKEVDELINKSWDEILGVIGNRQRGAGSRVDLERLEDIIERAVAHSANLPRGAASSSAAAPTTYTARPADVGALPEAPKDRLTEEQSESSAEEVEELEEIETAEPVDVEEAEEVESAEESQDGEDLEELEELDELEEIEELEEVESIEDSTEQATKAAASGDDAEDHVEVAEIEESGETEEVPADKIEPTENASGESEPEVDKTPAEGGQTGVESAPEAADDDVGDLEEFEELEELPELPEEELVAESAAPVEEVEEVETDVVEHGQRGAVQWEEGPVAQLEETSDKEPDEIPVEEAPPEAVEETRAAEVSADQPDQAVSEPEIPVQRVLREIEEVREDWEVAGEAAGSKTAPRVPQAGAAAGTPHDLEEEAEELELLEENGDEIDWEERAENPAEPEALWSEGREGDSGAEQPLLDSETAEEVAELEELEELEDPDETDSLEAIEELEEETSNPKADLSAGNQGTPPFAGIDEYQGEELEALEELEEVSGQESAAELREQLEELPEYEDVGFTDVPYDPVGVEPQHGMFMAPFLSFGGDTQAGRKTEDDMAGQGVSEEGAEEAEEVLEEPEELREPEEIQQGELEEVLEGDEDADAVEDGEDETESGHGGAARKSSSGIRFASIEERDTDAYQIVTIEELLQLQGGHTVINESGNLVQIDERAYSEAPSAGEAGMKRLVDSVIGSENPIQTAETQGIDDILSSTSGLDLFPIGEDEESDTPPSPGLSGPYDEDEERFFITERGIDYDRFLRGYKKSESGVFKSLIEFTRVGRVRVASIFVDFGERLRPEYTLGAEEQCMDKIEIPKSSPFYSQVLGKRSVLLLRYPLDRYELFHGKCDEEQFNYIGRILFVPIVFRQKDAYLMLGVKEDVQRIGDFLELYMPVFSASSR